MNRVVHRYGKMFSIGQAVFGNLNPEQLRAVTAGTNGAFACCSGPGSGKVCRLLYILNV